MRGIISTVLAQAIRNSIVMQKSEQINELATALSAFHGDTENLIKDRVGHHASYTTLANVLEVVRPLLAKHGISLCQLPTKHETEIAIESILMHKSGQYVSSVMSMPVEGGKLSGCQQAGVVLSYLRRYMAVSMLSLASDDDTDGEQPRVIEKKPSASEVAANAFANLPPIQ